MDAAVRLLERAVQDGVTPGYAACAVHRGEVRLHVAGGLRRVVPRRLPATEDTRYDIASITKLFTAATSLRLAARGALELDAEVVSLLDHTSGLPAWLPLHEAAEPAAAAAAARPEAPPGVRQRYSDIGYIRLGWRLAEAGGADLGRLVEAEVLEPLALRETGWHPAEPPPVAATFDALPAGEPDDDNCRALGGVCGHAGLYATARDLARFGEALLACYRGDDRWLPPPLLRRAFHERPPLPGATHALGFDSPTPGRSSAGRRASAEAVGHLGFTGTSLWIDPPADLIVVLLTNRIHPRRDGPGAEGIKRLRPAFHDAVYEAAAHP